MNLYMDGVSFYNNTCVLPAIRPSEFAFSLHFVIDPIAFVFALVLPSILSEAFNVVAFECTTVDSSVRPHERALAFLFAIDVISLVGTLITPDLCAMSMLIKV